MGGFSPPCPPNFGEGFGFFPLPFGLKSRDFGFSRSCQSTLPQFPPFPPKFLLPPGFSHFPSLDGRGNPKFGEKSQFWGFFHPIPHQKNPRFPLPLWRFEEFSQKNPNFNCGGSVLLLNLIFSSHFWSFLIQGIENPPQFFLSVSKIWNFPPFL